QYQHKGISRCWPCVRRHKDDTCRFQNFRYLLCVEDTLTSYQIRDPRQDRPTPLEFPTKWNVDLRPEHITKIKASNLALLPILRQEMANINAYEPVFRPQESEVRSTCDTCSTSIFSCSWVCLTCGREACPECFTKVNRLTEGSHEQTKEYLDHLQLEPTFLACERSSFHKPSNFSAITRIRKFELEEAISCMIPLVLYPDPPVSSGARGPVSLSVETHPPALQIPSYNMADLTEDLFRELWAKGDPLLVTDATRNFKLRWDPKYFITHYGEEICDVVECQAGTTKHTTVKAFFRTFGKPHRDGCFKLKDWPPQNDFQTQFPDLLADFNSAVPIPNYVRRDGVLNIAAHFAKNALPPDLGPKMYNAYANPRGTASGSNGSTALHMDMSDALNIMMYAAKGSDNPGGAAWDIFRADDSEKLRIFMRGKFYQDLAPGQDPIHSQQVYLDDESRLELWQKTGVASYRVYQKAGEAVFIPAGCAHQVCNLTDCIKVAIDFVSLENIERCAKVTTEFRHQITNGKARKEDALQLKTMLWFAWLSCCYQEQKSI
ncbi:hypothetical protein B0H12DRAFT_1014187, partial [Mycena haematopus]